MTTSAADKMLRLRARRRLANVVGRASAGFAWRLRRTSDALHAFFAKGDGIVQALACATCLFVTTAGAASLAPGFDSLDRNAATDAVMVDRAATGSMDMTNDLNHASMGTEVLSPSRNDYSATAGSGREKFGRGPGAAEAAGSGTTEAGSTVGLPSNAPIPSGNLPAPPSTPHVPEEPPGAQVEADLPEEPPVPMPDAPTEEIVEEVTGALGKASR